jgi:OOP family OmpA-OmpF porin
VIRLLCLMILGATPVPAAALPLPDGAEVLADATAADAGLLLATGPFRDGAVPGETLAGRLRQQSWRIPGPGTSTSALHDALVAALAADGGEIVFACAARACGGFDFRFALDLLPEPQMHVDLADFRYAAIRGEAGQGSVLVVSRSADAAFVQLSTLSPALVATAAPVPSAIAAAPAPAEAPADLAAFGAALEGGGALVLQDLAFAVGAGTLADPAAGSLQAIAAYLKANPDRSVAIVGHTDASGTLEANIALSRDRARAVRAALVALGADGDRITAEGVGFLAPRATNLTEAGRQANRRVEVMLTSTR